MLIEFILFFLSTKKHSRSIHSFFLLLMNNSSDDQSFQMKLKNVSVSKRLYDTNPDYRAFQETRKMAVENFIKTWNRDNGGPITFPSNHSFRILSSGFDWSFSIDSRLRGAFITDLKKQFYFVKIGESSPLGFSGSDIANEIKVIVPFGIPLKPTQFFILALFCLLLIIVLSSLLAVINPDRYGSFSFPLSVLFSS